MLSRRLCRVIPSKTILKRFTSKYVLDNTYIKCIPYKQPFIGNQTIIINLNFIKSVTYDDKYYYVNIGDIESSICNTSQTSYIKLCRIKNENLNRALKNII